MDRTQLPKDQGKIAIPLIPGALPKSDAAWRQLCLPLLMSLSRQSANAAREVRHNAISQLQRILLGPRVTTDELHLAQVEEIFNRVIFPLLDDLL